MVAFVYTEIYNKSTMLSRVVRKTRFDIILARHNYTLIRPRKKHPLVVACDLAKLYPIKIQKLPSAYDIK